MGKTSLSEKQAQMRARQARQQRRGFRPRVPAEMLALRRRGTAWLMYRRGLSPAEIARKVNACFGTAWTAEHVADWIRRGCPLTPATCSDK